MGNFKWKWRVEDYDIKKTGVSFNCSDEKLKSLFDKCERLCKENTKTFGDYNVLIEGAVYNGVWLETQPMGGEMYAKRDIKIALANILIFLRYQRRDGKMPGMINIQKWLNSITPHYDWMQGVFLPYPALKLYYLIKDSDYLNMLYVALKDFDNCLWRERDSTKNGCLESWCIWDVGEDNSTVHMLHGLKMPDHGPWAKSTPPTEYPSLPHKSPQYMGYSYAIRSTLAKISQILNNGEEEYWLQQAKVVQENAKKYLWDDKLKAFYLKDKDGKVIDALTQENIKCMYSGLMTKEMANDFIDKHLLNPEEFFTPYPLPAIAANSKYFHVDKEHSNCHEELEQSGNCEDDINENSWSGPLNGLIWQRSITALLNYDRHIETAIFGEKILNLLKNTRILTQNYNPFTGLPASKGTDGYGPTMLSALEYISMLYGVNLDCDKVYFSALSGMSFDYSQTLGDDVYKLESDGKICSAYLNNNKLFSFNPDYRILTDIKGNVISIHPLKKGLDSNNAIIK